MVEIRFHGRGGQGIVVASEILAQALFFEGKEVQSFPSFGAERRGAPVAAFIRCDNQPIRRRTHIYHPDHVLVMAPSLIKMGVDFTQGLKKQGILVLNYGQDPARLSQYEEFNVHGIDANSIAVKHGLGTPQAPMVNCVMLGAFIGATSLTSIESLIWAISKKLAIRPKQNIEGAVEAFNVMRTVPSENN